MSNPLPANWQDPAYAQHVKAWDEHEQHDLLAQLVDERDAEGLKTWETVKMPDPDDPTWTAIYLQPIDPRDTRPRIRITTYPQNVMDQQVADAQAIADEHADD